MKRLVLLLVLLIACPTSADETTRAEAAQRAEQRATERLEQVRADLITTQQVLATGDSGDEAGELLWVIRRRTPDPQAAERRVETRERQIARAKLEQFRLAEDRRSADDPAALLQLEQQLDDATAEVAALQETLADERVLAKEADELVDLLQRQLLWISSAPPVGPTWVQQVVAGTEWLLWRDGWLRVGQTFLKGLAQSPIAATLVTLLTGALIFVQPVLFRRMRHLAEEVKRYSTDGFLLTVRAFVLTILVPLPVPAALFGVGGLLEAYAIGAFPRSIGQGLITAGFVALLLGFFRTLCREGGLADVHFGWNDRARRTLRNNLWWLTLLEVPMAFVAAACEASGEETYTHGLGRLAFIVGSLGLTLFVARVFRPTHGIFGEIMSRDGWAWRTRQIWYVALVALPLGMTIAAALGYLHTAAEVQGRYFTSGAIILGGAVLYSLAARWLAVARKRLAIQQARQKLIEQREARLAKGEAEPATGDAAPELETQHVDVDAASDQTLRLVRTFAVVGIAAALWAIWQDILPALAILERVALTAPTLDGDGAVIVPAITLWSVVLGAFAVTLTVIAARNLPAVLELVVLQRFPLDAGTRYAATILARYVVIAIGVVIASNLLGIQWGKAQWIVAALGVGLGFGLQEIVANFVSGLIILFERPVRVGDVVTVGGVDGTVSRLQIRATTITDWDNKEVIVPNKSFITDQVINWTLSNPMTRLLIPIGVAYGTDVQQARAAIQRAVDSVPAVLQQPGASVLFTGFGDSSLDFQVRAFVDELSKRLTTSHELHAAIERELTAANIEIPFPQRDLHIRDAATLMTKSAAD